jgi:hypothetical protein
MPAGVPELRPWREEMFAILPNNALQEGQFRGLRKKTVNLIPKLRPEPRESRAEFALAPPGFWCHDIGICRATTIKRANTNALILIL